MNRVFPFFFPFFLFFFSLWDLGLGTGVVNISTLVWMCGSGS